MKGFQKPIDETKIALGYGTSAIFYRSQTWNLSNQLS